MTTPRELANAMLSFVLAHETPIVHDNVTLMYERDEDGNEMFIIRHDFIEDLVATRTAALFVLEHVLS